MVSHGIESSLLNIKKYPYEPENAKVVLINLLIFRDIVFFYRKPSSNSSLFRVKKILTNWVCFRLL